MRVHENAAERGLKVYDTALPQDWFDNASSLSGANPSGHVVWSYDYERIFGSPAAVDAIGELILLLVHLADARMDDDDRATAQQYAGAARRSIERERENVL